MKPYPALGEISSENIVSTQQSRTQTACASGLPEKYSISGQAGMAYHWNTDLGHSVFKDSSGKVETDTLKNNILITWPSHAANHNLVVYGEAGGCFSLAKSLIVQVNNLPVVSLGGDVNLCQGQGDTFTIDGNYKSIKWPDQTTGDTYSTNKNDTVVVVVTDQKNCVGTDTAIVKVYPLPVVKLGKDTMLCGDHTLVPQRR